MDRVCHVNARRLISHQFSTNVCTYFNLPNWLVNLRVDNSIYLCVTVIEHDIIESKQQLVLYHEIRFNGSDVICHYEKEFEFSSKVAMYVAHRCH